MPNQGEILNKTVPNKYCKRIRRMGREERGWGQERLSKPGVTFLGGGGPNTCCASRRYADARHKQGQVRPRRGAITRRHKRRRRRSHSLVTPRHAERGEGYRLCRRPLREFVLEGFVLSVSIASTVSTMSRQMSRSNCKCSPRSVLSIVC